MVELMTQADRVGCRGVLRAMTEFHGRAVKGVMRKSRDLPVILVNWTRPRSVSGLDIGQDASGEIFVLSKSDGVVRRFVTLTAVPEPSSVATAMLVHDHASKLLHFRRNPNRKRNRINQLSRLVRAFVSNTIKCKSS